MCLHERARITRDGQLGSLNVIISYWESRGRIGTANVLEAQVPSTAEHSIGTVVTITVPKLERSMVFDSRNTDKEMGRSKFVVVPREAGPSESRIVVLELLSLF